MATHTVQFNKEVTFTNHTGVKFVNTTTAETATLVSSATVSPASVIVYTLTWVTDPVTGDVVQWEYDGLGNYIDNSGDEPVPMDAQTLILTNCLDSNIPTNALLETTTLDSLLEVTTGQILLEA